MTQIDHAESHSANHFRGPFRQKLPGTWCTVHPYAHEDLFLVFDFRFVFSSFGHENIFFVQIMRIRMCEILQFVRLGK